MDHVASTYNEIAKQYAAEFSSPTDYLDDFLKLVLMPATILDVGCGPGVEIACCTEKGFKTDGIDLSPEMVALAKVRNPGVDIQLADILDFSSSEKYDACIASYSLIHLSKQDVPKALSTIHSVLGDKGYLYVSVHEGQSSEGLIDEPFNPKLKIFLNVFSKEEMLGLLDAAGFKILETKTREAASAEEFPLRKLILFTQAI